ncbi:hypothetical protein ACGVWS_12715 [Enterobacteriaceae bacterium LUAb1]
MAQEWKLFSTSSQFPDQHDIVNALAGGSACCQVCHRIINPLPETQSTFSKQCALPSMRDPRDISHGKQHHPLISIRSEASIRNLLHVSDVIDTSLTRGHNMAKIFLWDPDQDQVFTADYGTQYAALKEPSTTFWKNPGKTFTMHEDTAGMTLTLRPSRQIKMAFPWDDESDGNGPLTSMHLKNGTLALEFLTGNLGDDLFFGFDSPLNLSLSNHAKLTADNFASAQFSEHCTTHLKDSSSIALSLAPPSPASEYSFTVIQSPITLTDSSSLIIHSPSVYIHNTISCSKNATVNIHSNEVIVKTASFHVSDLASVTLLHKDETIPVFDFEKQPFGQDLFSFDAPLDSNANSPVITFTATMFNQIILNRLMSQGTIKNNYPQRSLKWKHEGGNKYSIGPKL